MHEPTFQRLYLDARKRIEVTKFSPGSYSALHPGLHITAQANKHELALSKCALLAARRLQG